MGQLIDKANSQTVVECFIHGRSDTQAVSLSSLYHCMFHAKLISREHVDTAPAPATTPATTPVIHAGV